MSSRPASSATTVSRSPEDLDRAINSLLSHRDFGGTRRSGHQRAGPSGAAGRMRTAPAMPHSWHAVVQARLRWRHLLTPSYSRTCSRLPAGVLVSREAKPLVRLRRRAHGLPNADVWSADRYRGVGVGDRRAAAGVLRWPDPVGVTATHPLRDRVTGPRARREVSEAFDHAGDFVAMLSEATRETRARLYQALDFELLLDPAGDSPTLDVRLQLCGGGGRI